MIHSRYLFQWKTKIQPWIHREKLPTWFSNCNLGYLIGKLVYGIPVQPRCINPHFVQGAKQNTSYHHSAHRPGIYPGSQTLIRLHDQHCRPVPWPRKSHLQGNQYRLQAWIYCPVQFCLFFTWHTSSVFYTVSTGHLGWDERSLLTAISQGFVSSRIFQLTS